MKRLLVLCAFTTAIAFAQNAVLRDLSCIAASASGTTYTCSIASAPSGYVTSARYAFKADVANTGAATINFNSLGAKTIKKFAATDLVANDIQANQWVYLSYDGTNMQMVSALGQASGGGGTTPVGNGPWFPLGYNELSAAAAPAGGGGSNGISVRFVVPGYSYSSHIVFYVTTAQTTGQGLIWGIFSPDLTTAYCVSSVLTATTTGAKSLTWASGSKVSGGVCQLPAGAYNALVTADGSTVLLAGYYLQDQRVNDMMIANNDGGPANSGAGFASGMSTGTGGSVAFIGNPGSLTYTEITSAGSIPVFALD